MIQSTPFAECVRQAFQPTPRGVIGLVDDLFEVSRDHQLHLRFEEGRCAVRRLGADEADALMLPLPKSVFRAALARVAALCHEQHPGSVTPYRGACEIAVPPSSPQALSPSTCHVSFVNTASDQQLELRFSGITIGDGRQFTVLLRDQRIVMVRGHALRYIPHDSNPSDAGSYGILSRDPGGEIMVALFRVSEVIGVYHGDLDEPGGDPSSDTKSTTEPELSARDAQRREAADAPNWPL